MSTLSSKLQRIEENINSIRTVSGLEGRVLEEIPTEIETKFNELNTTITTKDEQITELNTTVETKDEQISSLNTTISEKDTEIETLNNTVTEKEAELTTANETIATQAAEIETLNNRIAELEGSTKPSTYQIDIAFRDSETRELLETEYTTSVSLSNADGGLIGTFTDSCAGIIIRDLAPGTYNLAFNEISIPIDESGIIGEDFIYLGSEDIFTTKLEGSLYTWSVEGADNHVVIDRKYKGKENECRLICDDDIDCIGTKITLKLIIRNSYGADATYTKEIVIKGLF